MGGGFVKDNQKPTCSKRISPTTLPPQPPPPVQIVDVENEPSANSSPILVHPPSLVTQDDRENDAPFVPPSSVNSKVPPPPSSEPGHDNQRELMQSSERVNGNNVLPSFSDAFPSTYEQKFRSNSWFPRSQSQQGANSHQMNSSRYQSNTGTSCYQNPRSIQSNNGFNTDHSYANQRPFTTEQQPQKPCMANEIFSFLKTCVHQLDVAMTNGPASSKLSSCVHVLQEIRTVIINGENQFNHDLMHNGHKGHDYTYCGNGLSGKRNAFTQVEQEPATANTIETVRLTPPQTQPVEH